MPPAEELAGSIHFGCLLGRQCCACPCTIQAAPAPICLHFAEECLHSAANAAACRCTAPGCCRPLRSALPTVSAGWGKAGWGLQHVCGHPRLVSLQEYPSAPCTPCKKAARGAGAPCPSAAAAAPIRRARRPLLPRPRVCQPEERVALGLPQHPLQRQRGGHVQPGAAGAGAGGPCHARKSAAAGPAYSARRHQRRRCARPFLRS